MALGKGGNLTARNELRLSDRAVLTLDGGTVSSLRWVDVKLGAKVRGSGKIDATLYNAGEVNLASVTGESSAPLLVTGDYTESESAVLAIFGANPETAKMTIAGKATLCGILKIEVPEQIQLKIGSTWAVLSAGKVVGRFANVRNMIQGRDGTQFSIHYSENEVMLRVESLGKTNRFTAVELN